MDNLNFLNLAIAFAAVLVGTFALVQNHKKNKFEKLVVQAQGIFKKSDIKICCYGIGAKDDMPDLFIIAAKLKPQKIVLFPFIIHVVNVGDKTAEEMALYVRYPKDIHSYKDELIAEVFPNLDGYKKGQYFTEGHFQTGVYEIKKIDPRSGIFIHDFLTISKGSFFKGEVKTKTSDNIPVVVPYSIEYNFVMSYTLYQKDCSPLSGDIQVYVLDTSKRSIVQFVADRNKKAKKQWEEKAGKGLKKFLYLLKLNWKKTSVSGNKPIQRIKVIAYKESEADNHPEHNAETVKEEDMFMYD